MASATRGGLVSRNDVLYTTPSVEPWEAMPTGGGDLSAMVRFDGALHLHLTKSDAWGFQESPDTPAGARFFNNVSPGHVAVGFGPAGMALAREGFEQRLDLYHGRVTLRLGDAESGPRLSIWGHPVLRVLVVEVSDPAHLLDAPEVELGEWRPSMRVGHDEASLHACEVHERPARPHLSNTGMADYFPADRDPLLGRGTAVVVTMPGIAPASIESAGSVAVLRAPMEVPYRYRVLISVAVTVSGDPLIATRRELQAAAEAPLDELRAEHRAWWREFWDRSFIRLESPDRGADRLCAAYHVHLYTLGCVNRGAVPAKWDGGPGLMREDERNWGLAEWVQEIRFTYLPLYAANQLDMARGLSAHYSAMVPYLEAQTEGMWGLPGTWVPETVLPWGHAEDFVLKGDPHEVQPTLHRWHPDQGPYGRFEWYNPYVGFLFTAGLEVCHHTLTYYRHAGDEAFRREQLYPMVRGVCEFICALLRQGDDGRCHLDPANALETWWMVRDPADTLAGIQAIFPEFIVLARELGRNEELSRRCAEVLATLPDPPLGHWRADGVIEADADVYAPAALPPHAPTRTNHENPQLYRLFPFGLSGIGAPDYERMRRTFACRICPQDCQWSLDPVWAARLGLGEEACALLLNHARKFNRFRYGGWDAVESSVFPGGLAAAPFLDGAGLSAYGLQQVLLQSHNGVIRVAPAVSKAWSGTFRLLAEGGFLVEAGLEQGSPVFVQVLSLRGGECRLANPWPGGCRVGRGEENVLQTEAREFAFTTDAGATYVLTEAGREGARSRPVPVPDEPHRSPGLRGRDF